LKFELFSFKHYDNLSTHVNKQIAVLDGETNERRNQVAKKSFLWFFLFVNSIIECYSLVWNIPGIIEQSA